MGMRVLCWGIVVVLLVGGACRRLDDDEYEHNLPGITGGSPATAGCASGLDCDTNCWSNADCDSHQGRICVFAQPTEPNPSLDAPTQIERWTPGDDAGQELDAGSLRPTSSGHCTAYCATTACEQGMVCSSTGICREGCDYQRPECMDDQYCDFAASKCVPKDGSCKSDGDCPLFDADLATRGTRHCDEAGRCRFTPSTGFGMSVDFLSTIEHDAGSIAVHQPSAGQRIVDVRGFTFQFDVPAEVMVLAILLRPHRSLADAANVALWTAYVDGDQAMRGVSLSDGGAIIDGKWVQQLPDLPSDEPLFFLAVGYKAGVKVAESRPIPFMVGGELPKSGDACPDLADGSFCSELTALICVQQVCRTPCLSDDDCAAGQTCDKPGFRSVAARVCR